jgi:hypothetical protein
MDNPTRLVVWICAVGVVLLVASIVAASWPQRNYVKRLGWSAHHSAGSFRVLPAKGAFVREAQRRNFSMSTASQETPSRRRQSRSRPASTKPYFR